MSKLMEVSLHIYSKEINVLNTNSHLRPCDPCCFYSNVPLSISSSMWQSGRLTAACSEPSWCEEALFLPAPGWLLVALRAGFLKRVSKRAWFIKPRNSKHSKDRSELSRRGPLLLIAVMCWIDWTKCSTPGGCCGGGYPSGSLLEEKQRPELSVWVWFTWIFLRQRLQSSCLIGSCRGRSHPIGPRLHRTKSDYLMHRQKNKHVHPAKFIRWCLLPLIHFILIHHSL